MDIDESQEDEKKKNDEEMQSRLKEEREKYARKIEGTMDENERQRLIQEMKDREKQIENEIENDRLRQERTLQERRQNRLNKKKIKEMEIDAKNLNELQKREMELKQKHFNEELATFNKNLEQEVGKLLNQIEKHQDKQDQTLMVVQESADEALKKKMKMLINKQFFELSKYLGGLYQDLAMKRVVEKE